MNGGTLALARVQARILAVPFFVVGISYALLLIPSDIMGNVACVALLSTACLSGAILFGEEYRDGGKDYLSTRPVGAEKVLEVKGTVLLFISFLCVIPAGLTFNWYRDHLRDTLFVGFTWMAAIDAAFLFAISTILLKDIVRGILWGMLVVPPVVWGLIIGWNSLVLDRAKVLSTDETIVLLPSTTASILSIVTGLFVIVPVLGLLSTVYLSQRYGRIRITKTLLLGSVGMILWSAGVYSQRKTEGITTVTRDASGSYSEILGSRIVEDRLVWIGKHGQKVFLNVDSVVDEKTERAGPIELKLPGAECEEVYLNDDRLLITDFRDNKGRLYDVSDVGNPRVIKDLSLTWSPAVAYQVHGSVYTYTPVEAASPEIRTIRLSDGVIKDETQTHLSKLESLQWWRWTWKLFMTEDDWEVYEAKNIEYMLSPSFDGVKLLMGIRAKDSLNLATISASDGFKCIDLSHFNPDSDVINGKVRVPIRFRVPWIIPQIIAKWIPSFQMAVLYDLYLTVGNGFLTLSHGDRLAVWDIRNPSEPTLVGFAPIPKWTNLDTTYTIVGHSPQLPTQPILRPDGALGYLTKQGLIWLEFPALMKETDPS